MTAIVRDVNRSPAGRDAGGFGWAVGEIWDTGCAVSPVPDGAMGSGPIGADAGRFEGAQGEIWDTGMSDICGAARAR